MRSIKQSVKVLVEGFTEKYYISGLKSNTTTQLNIQPPVNMNGGGYENFIREVKRIDHRGCVAIFIFIDLDKYDKEKGKLEELINICNKRSKNTSIPFFLIGTNKDFEYFSCCHFKSYNNGDTTSFIIKNLNYKTLDEYKSDRNVYNKLNKNSNSYKNALEKTKKNYSLNNVFIKNIYDKKINGANIIISKSDTQINHNSMTNKHSNIIEFFEIIGLS